LILLKLREQLFPPPPERQGQGRPEQDSSHVNAADFYPNGGVEHMASPQQRHGPGPNEHRPGTGQPQPE
jgi:hypothetical protein